MAVKGILLQERLSLPILSTATWKHSCHMFHTEQRNGTKTESQNLIPYYDEGDLIAASLVFSRIPEITILIQNHSINIHNNFKKQLLSNDLKHFSRNIKQPSSYIRNLGYPITLLFHAYRETPQVVKACIVRMCAILFAHA